MSSRAQPISPEVPPATGPAIVAFEMATLSVVSQGQQQAPRAAGVCHQPQGHQGAVDGLVPPPPRGPPSFSSEIVPHYSKDQGLTSPSLQILGPESHAAPDSGAWKCLGRRHSPHLPAHEDKKPAAEPHGPGSWLHQNHLGFLKTLELGGARGPLSPTTPFY